MEGLNKVYGRLLDGVLVPGSFRPNGASGIVSNSTKGQGFSVARTSAGLYTVTFDEKWPSVTGGGLVGFYANARIAAAENPVIVKGSVVSQANKTAQIRLWQAATGGVTEGKGIIPLPLHLFTSFTKKLPIPGTDVVPDPSNPPVAVATGDTIAWGFDADNEQVGISFQVPQDWDGVSDITLKFGWHPQSGTAIADTKTVIWQYSYHAINGSGEAVDNGTDVDAAVTYTQSGAGTDKEGIVSSIALDYDNANQPLTPGDIVTGTFGIDFTTMTYAAGVMFMHAWIEYNSSTPVADQPFLQRVNGATDRAMRLAWPVSDVTLLQLLGGVPKPPDFSAAADITIHFMAKMAGATDTPTLGIGTWDGEGDTEVVDTSGALSDSLAEVIATIGNADLAAPPGFLNFRVTPGAHTTDILYIYSAWIEYTRSDFATTGQVFALTDLAADADNEVDFLAVIQDSLVAA